MLWPARGFEGIFIPLITKDLPCSGVREQREDSVIVSEAPHQPPPGPGQTGLTYQQEEKAV